MATLQTIRLTLVVSAAVAVSACAAGTQQTLPTANNAALTPQTGARLTTTLSADRNASDEHRDVEGGDDGNGTVVYSSIPKPLKAVASVGFEATTGLQLGDGVNLTHTGKLQRVRYVLSSWGCQSGHWNTNNCVTSPGATFPVPITINVYAVSNSSPSRVGALLKTQTRTFNIPYRPSYDSVRCTGTGEFYSAVDASCVHGLANVIVFDFSAPRVSLPLQSIFSLVYNTSHYGPSPIGQSAPCYTSPGGCGYDSLNVSTDGNGGPIGSPIDPNGIFDSFVLAAEYCDPLLGTGFRLDTAPGCWTGFHPQFEVRVGSGGDDNHREGHDD
ncbi:MAG TPA: hypothetical protein VGU66_21980 [Candidatus Elarobacter sp.]|nr:hypothetical protein [Candidatus Elarobacter sp.]